MSATVDHLSTHHRFKVIRAFLDARGHSVTEGATGVITHIDLDLKAMEFAICWTRDGSEKDERLTFSLSATDGPRNNHMREYFEKLEFVAPPPREKPKAKPPQPGAVEFVVVPLACSCGPAFHRSVYPAGRLNVHACMKCGSVIVTRTVGDDGRHTGNAWTSYLPVPTPQPVIDWLGLFPRVAIDHSGAPWRWPMSASLVRYPTLLYPAHVRIGHEIELKGAEDMLWDAQSPQSRADRLGFICGDIPRPPTGLSDDFAGFAAIQRVLQMTPDTELETLRTHANLISPASELAAALLMQRADAYDTMMTWLHSPSEDDFSAGIAMLRDARPLFAGPDDPRLASELSAIMDALPLGKLKDVPDRVESWWRFEALLVAIADLGARNTGMIASLGAIQKKLARKDAIVADAIRIVINELQGVDNRPPQAR